MGKTIPYNIDLDETSVEINVFLKKRKLFKPGASFPFLVFGLNQEMLNHHRGLVLDHDEAEDY